MVLLLDGNVLVGCKKEEQASKTLKLKEIRGVKVVTTNRAGLKEGGGSLLQHLISALMKSSVI